MATIRDVARRAGVSVAAAGRALGGYGYTSSRTRARVIRAAHSLDYHPNAIARSMINGRTQTLAVIVSDNANPFFASVVRGIEDTVLSQGYGIVLCNADEDPAKEAMYVGMVRQKRVDGLIISPSGGSRSLLHNLRESGTPIVQIDRRLSGLASDAVVIDNRTGARAAVAHLIKLGHRRIAMISGPRRLYTGRERIEGYVAVLRDARITPSADLILEGTFKEASGHELAGRLLSLRRRPTAVFIANNLMTIGALLRFKEAGVCIPEDLAVVGFDDMEWAPILTPPLTAVAQPARELGSAAGRLLLERIGQSRRGRSRTIVLRPHLVVRESCGSARQPLT